MEDSERITHTACSRVCGREKVLTTDDFLGCSLSNFKSMNMTSPCYSFRKVKAD